MSATQLPQGMGSVEGERHVSEVAGRKGFSRKQGIMLIACATGAALAFILLRPHPEPRDPNRLTDDRLQVRQVTRYEPPLSAPALPVALSIPQPQFTPPPIPTQPITAPSLPLAQGDPMARARRAPLLAYSAGAAVGPTFQSTEGAVTPNAAPPSELAARLRATPISGVSASILPNQPYLLTKGNVLPCVLQTAMDSTLPGFVTCRTSQAIIGKTGIILLDRGTLVVGEFQGGIRQGQERLFVLWTRAETPNGVVIELDSPAADPLGRAGFAGEVDSHFWQRFGGALLLSLVQGGIQAGVAQASQQGSTYINTGSVEGVASEALRNSVNIPPTLRKSQGEIVSIFVARDLDFSTVYQVGTR